MVNFEDLDYKRLDNESEEDYQLRICSLKEQKGLYWDEVAQIINRELDLNYTESRYRKLYSAYKKGREETIEETMSLFSEEDSEIRQKFANATDKAAYYKLLRQDSRFERFYSLIAENIKQLPAPQFLNDNINNTANEKEYVLGFADLHIGANFVTINNKYSIEEVTNRFNKALAYCKTFIEERQLTKLTVLSLGDELQGMLRINDVKMNEVAVVDAFVFACRLIANFLNNLSAYCKIDYKMVAYSNHNQTRPLGTKASEIASEDMGKILYNYLKDTLALNEGISIESNLDNDFVEFNIFGFNCIALHGHQVKNIGTIVKDLSNQHRKFYDYVFLAHTHSAKEFISGVGKYHDVEVLSLPSVVGECPYAQSLMVSSKAGMKIYEFDKKFGHTASYKIILN